MLLTTVFDSQQAANSATDVYSRGLIIPHTYYWYPALECY